MAISAGRARARFVLSSLDPSAPDERGYSIGTLREAREPDGRVSTSGFSGSSTRSEPQPNRPSIPVVVTSQTMTCRRLQSYLRNACPSGAGKLGSLRRSGAGGEDPQGSNFTRNGWQPKLACLVAAPHRTTSHPPLLRFAYLRLSAFGHCTVDFDSAPYIHSDLLASVCTHIIVFSATDRPRLGWLSRCRSLSTFV